MKYQFATWCLDSAVPLALVPCPRCESDRVLRLQVGHQAAQLAHVDPFLMHGQRDDPAALYLYKEDATYYFQFSSLVQYQFQPTQRTITIVPSRDIPSTTTDHLLLDQVLPRVLDQLGQTMLHAAAVQVQHSAIVFIGDTGAGKSTLTASLAQHGFPVLTDDCLLLEPDSQCIEAVGTYAGLRLWPDARAAVLTDVSAVASSVAHYSDKERIAARSLRFTSARLPIEAIYLLEPTAVRPSSDSAIQFERVPPAESLVRLIESSFRLDITDRERNRREFAALSRVASLVPVYRFGYRHDYDRLTEICQALIEHTCQRSSEEGVGR